MARFPTIKQMAKEVAKEAMLEITIGGIPLGEAIKNKQLICVIRCKDCWWYTNIYTKADGTPDKRHKPTYCGFHQIETKEDDYCSYAQKKEASYD